jgi:hypothetical protein
MVGKNIAHGLGAICQDVSELAPLGEIFFCYEKSDLVGADETKKIPLGAIGVYSIPIVKVGLQQLMGGARCFSLDG